jgi:hypothetical protein
LLLFQFGVGRFAMAWFHEAPIVATLGIRHLKTIEQQEHNKRTMINIEHCPFF